MRQPTVPGNWAACLPRLGRTLLVALFVATLPTPARAQSPYSLDPVREAIIVGSGAAGSAAALLRHGDVAPLTQADVEQLSRSDVNAFDRGATYRYSLGADEASDWLVYGLVLSPLALLGSDAVRGDFGTYGTIYGETLLLTLATVQLAKGIVLRTRPYAYNPDVPLEKKTQADTRKSFYSSHTAFAFASAVFLCVTFQAYEPDSPLRPWIWGTTIGAAAAVGVLRYTSGSHFPTDILVGAAIGTLAGIVVPALHRVGAEDVALSPSVGSRGVNISFRVSL